MRARLLSLLLVGVISCDFHSAGPAPSKKLKPVDGGKPSAQGAALNSPAEQASNFDPVAFLGDPEKAEMPLPNGPNDSVGLPISSSPVRGDAKALVTIYEFSDLQCPFCDKGRQVIKEVTTKYGDQVRLVWKNLPLIEIHPNALPAAAALMALQRQGPDVFWTAEEALFDAHNTWGGRDSVQLTPEQFEKYLAQVPGINLEQWRSDVKSPAIAQTIAADLKLAAYVDVSSTPTFFINGRKLSGAYPVEEMSRIIDGEIAAVKEELARGTSPEAVFAMRMKKNLVTADTRYQIEATGPGRGATDPKVTIVAFSDFQCPYCAKGEAELLTAIAPFPDDVKVVYRNLPLVEIHPDAYLAAEAALAANEQGKYLEYHKKLFENQRLPDPQNPQGRSGLTRPDLERYAEELGLDLVKFKSALDEHRFKPVIDRDMAVMAALEVNGTPAYYINGKLLHGAYPADEFTKTINDEIKTADEMLAKGVPRANLYQELMKDAYAPQP